MYPTKTMAFSQEPVQEGEAMDAVGNADCEFACGEAVNPDEWGESSPMRGRPVPEKPTAQEIEQHNLDHYPYRSWCRCCVAAAGRADSHHRGRERDPDEVPFYLNGLYRFHRFRSRGAAAGSHTHFLAS